MYMRAIQVGYSCCGQISRSPRYQIYVTVLSFLQGSLSAIWTITCITFLVALRGHLGGLKCTIPIQMEAYSFWSLWNYLTPIHFSRESVILTIFHLKWRGYVNPAGCISLKRHAASESETSQGMQGFGA